jgi:hypothetical protein
MFKKEIPKLEFWTEVPGLSGLKELRPQRMNKFLPEWWKRADYKKESIKTCPSFPDIFNYSFVVPMWCDTRFFKQNGDLFWEVPDAKFPWSIHPKHQFTNFLPTKIKNKYDVAKAQCPWKLKTPKGYSVYEMPVFWHLNENISLAPGIIDTDIFHSINPDFFIHLEEGESFVINRGEPLISYFPFKRQSFQSEAREKTLQDDFNGKKSDLIWQTKFIGGYLNHRKNYKDI